MSKAVAKADAETVKDTGVRSTGDIISRLGSDAGIVGEGLTRELSEGLRYVLTPQCRLHTQRMVF